MFSSKNGRTSSTIMILSVVDRYFLRSFGGNGQVVPNFRSPTLSSTPNRLMASLV